MNYPNPVTNDELVSLEQETLNKFNDFFVTKAMEKDGSINLDRGGAIVAAALSFAVAQYRELFGQLDTVELLYDIADFEAGAEYEDDHPKIEAVYMADPLNEEG